MTIWATGTGLAGDPLPDGSTATSASTASLPIVVPGAQVIYAGQAPDAIQGLTQINFQLPHQVFTFNTYYFQLGASRTAGAQVWVTAN